MQYSMGDNPLSRLVAVLWLVHPRIWLALNQHIMLLLTSCIRHKVRLSTATLSMVDPIFLLANSALFSRSACRHSINLFSVEILCLPQAATYSQLRIALYHISW